MANKKPDFEINLKKEVFGSSLHITVNRKKAFISWQVSDDFNDQSYMTPIDEDIHGFYKVGEKIKLTVYDKNNKATIIENVYIN